MSRHSTMNRRYARFTLLVTSLVVMATTTTARWDGPELGRRCMPARRGTWGVFCEVRSFCAGAASTNSDRCVDGQAPPPPQVKCCTQRGPAPRDEDDDDEEDEVDEVDEKDEVDEVDEVAMRRIGGNPKKPKRAGWGWRTRHTTPPATRTTTTTTTTRTTTAPATRTTRRPWRTRATRSQPPTRPTMPPATRPTMPPATRTTTTRPTRRPWRTRPTPGPPTRATTPPATRPTMPPATRLTTPRPDKTAAMLMLPTPAVAVKVARSKCSEYVQFQYESITDNSLLGNGAGKKERTCTMVGEPLISGGIKTKWGEFPHMVALGYQPEDTGPILWRCGGSLISERYVLTAAHCAFASSTRHVKWALLGCTRLDSPHGQRVAVAAVVKHPAYASPSVYHDIALLRLAAAPKMSPYLRPACVGIERLPLVVEPPTKDSAPFDITGWGLTETNGHPAEHLMKVDLYLAPFDSCVKAYRFLNGSRVLGRGVDPDSMVCITNLDASKDSCEGDSGGPVQGKLRGHGGSGQSNPFYCMYDVVGVTSYGLNTCGGGITASLYTNVRHYLPWIVSVVWPEALPS